MLCRRSHTSWGRYKTSWLNNMDRHSGPVCLFPLPFSTMLSLSFQLCASKTCEELLRRRIFRVQSFVDFSAESADGSFSPSYDLTGRCREEKGWEWPSQMFLAEIVGAVVRQCRKNRQKSWSVTDSKSLAYSKCIQIYPNVFQQKTRQTIVNSQ